MAILTPEQTQTAKESVAQIFFSMTGRAPEFAALDYYYREYVRLLDDQGGAPNAQELAFTALSAQIYGPAVENGETPPVDGVFSNSDFVSWVYNNVLNREPDEAGLEYYTDKLDTGATRLTDLIREVIAGTEGDERDSAIIANRTAVALEYAKWENSNPAMLKADPSLAVYSLTGITEDPATAEAALAELRGEVIPDGETYTLSAGIDTIAGTGLADVFNAHTLADSGENVTTLNEEDVIDGGDGIDTLNLTAKADYNDELVGTVRNIENINITGSDNIGRTLTGWQEAIIERLETELEARREALTDAETALDTAETRFDKAERDVDTLVDFLADNQLTTAVGNLNEDNGTASAIAAAIDLIEAKLDLLPASTFDSLQNLVRSALTTLESVSGDFDWTDANSWPNWDGLGGGSSPTYESNPTGFLAAVRGLAEYLLEKEVRDTFQTAVVDTLHDRDDAAVAVVEAESWLDSANEWRGRGTINASFFEGATAISVDGNRTDVENITNQSITLTGEDKFSLDNDGFNVNTLSYEDGVTEGIVNIRSSGAANSTIIFNGADLESASIAGAVTPSGTLIVWQADATTSIESLSLSISSDFNLDVTALEDLVHLDLSGSTGDVGTPNNLVDLTGLDFLQSYKGSQGADAIRIDIDEDDDVDADIDRVIDLGAGNDHLTLDVASPTGPTTDDDDSLTITLGAGNDEVNVIGALANVSIEKGAINNLISITDFNGAEDVLTFDVSAIDFDERDILTNVEAADIAAAKSLVAALEVAQGYTDADHFSTFVYDGATYIYSNNAGSTSLEGDGLIELVGFTGQLNDQNFVQEITA